ncbi:phage regulatory protein, rha family [Paenibacillus sp. CF095]|uniref:Rha family transcriptional regulator n=1 Tax=Paenibacillus sp. CF095 TaxID=1881033 RepID=UPI0008898629|nr:Rha family transcriptional regulator [Paenibacillus sp. CF095]SDC87315.1 phage regulatory protein, rha family [Paenibacillus sp. CF095]
MLANQQLVFIDNGRVLTDSLTVADVFGKGHAKVLRDIRELDCSAEFNESNFGLVDYIDTKGEKRPKYILTQDGFTFLAMGYTGKEAARFKEAYITQFNHMRQQLRQLSAPSYAIDDPIARAKRWIQEREETERIEAERSLLAEKVTEQGEQLTIMQPKADKYDAFLDSDGYASYSTVGKQFLGGMSAVGLRRWLQDNDILSKKKVDDVFLPRKGYESYFKVYPAFQNESVSRLGVKVTPLGIDALIEFFYGGVKPERKSPLKPQAQVVSLFPTVAQTPRKIPKLILNPKAQ